MVTFKFVVKLWTAHVCFLLNFVSFICDAEDWCLFFVEFGIFHISHAEGLEIVNIKKGGYGVNIHDTKISYVQVNTMQKNSALIAVLHLKVTVRPSTRSKNSHLTVSSRRLLAPVWAEFFARCRRHYICALKNTHAG